MEPVSEFLVVYLDSIDERLLDYLDGDDELRLDTVTWMRRYTNAMLDGSITPTDLAEEWPDWYLLEAAFVTAYAPEDVGELEERAAFHDAVENGEVVALTEADRAYLWALRLHLGMYPEMRTGDE
jgi:hypothetical protein